MKKINIITTILASTMIITAQLNAADQPSTTDAESKITALQKELANATNEAAKKIVEAMIIRDTEDQNEKIKTTQEGIITTTKQTLKETYDEIKTKIDQEQKNTSYFSQFISGTKKAGEYVRPFLLPFTPWSGGPESDQKKDLARSIIAELEKKKIEQPKKEKYFNTEIKKQQFISGNSIGTLKSAAAVAAILGAASLLDKYTGFFSSTGAIRNSIQSAD